MNPSIATRAPATRAGALPIALALLACLAAVRPAAAQCQSAALLASDGAEFHQFGQAVALDGERLLVGAHQYDAQTQTHAGAAYLFESVQGSWLERARLSPASGPVAHFGTALALEADRALVGAWGEDGAGTDAGAVFVYERAAGAWPQVQLLRALDAQPDDHFGEALALEGELLAVGAPHDAHLALDAGSVYLFERSGGVWQQSYKLYALDGESGDLFGSALALEGEHLLVGARGDRQAGWGSGSVYAYRKSGSVWVPSGRLSAADGQPGNQFGSALALEAPLAAIGAPGDDERGLDAGAAWLFHWDGQSWLPEEKLLAHDAREEAGFGSALDLFAPRLAIGEPLGDGAYPGAGAVHLFRSTSAGWQLEQRAWDEQGFYQDLFGTALELGPERLSCGAPRKDSPESMRGAAFVHELGRPAFVSDFCQCDSGAPCANEYALAGCANSTGVGARLEACGSASVGADDLRLAMTNLPHGRKGALFLGADTTRLPFGQGLRCVAPGSGALYRLPVQDSGNTGLILSGPGLVALSASFRLSGLITPGSTWYVQGWYRDPEGPCSGLQLTHALSVAFQL